MTKHYKSLLFILFALSYNYQVDSLDFNKKTNNHGDLGFRFSFNKYNFFSTYSEGTNYGYSFGIFSTFFKSKYVSFCPEINYSFHRYLDTWYLDYKYKSDRRNQYINITPIIMSPDFQGFYFILGAYVNIFISGKTIITSSDPEIKKYISSIKRNDGSDEIGLVIGVKQTIGNFEIFIRGNYMIKCVRRNLPYQLLMDKNIISTQIGTGFYF